MSAARRVTAILCAGAVAAVGFADAGAETTPATDAPQSMVMTLRLENVAGEELWGTDFDWVRRSPKEVVTLGASTNSIGSSEWTYVRGGLGGALADDLFGQASVEIGAGEQAGRSFDYRKVRSRLTRVELGGRLALFGEVQAYDIDRFESVLLEAGVSYRFSRPLAIRLSYLESVSGNWDSRIAAIRVDVDRALDYFFGGATGVSTPDLTNVVAGLEPEADYSEVYAGLSMPIFERHRMVLYLSQAEQGAIRRRALVVTWQRPLRGPKKGAP